MASIMTEGETMKNEAMIVASEPQPVAAAAPVYQQTGQPPMQQPVLMGYQPGNVLIGQQQMTVVMPPAGQPQLVGAPSQVMYYHQFQNQPVLYMSNNGGPIDDPCPGCQKTSMRAMRIVQLVFSFALVISCVGMMIFVSPNDYYYYPDVWTYDIWSIFPPLATTVMTIVQLCAKNPINPGCETPIGAAQCRSAGDLIFAIVLTIESALLMSISWIVVAGNIWSIGGFITFLLLSNLIAAILCITYWITYCNIGNCCDCCGCIPNESYTNFT